jgi:magnesium transporter
MKVTVYRIAKDHYLHPLPIQEMDLASLNQESHVWIDLEGATPEELETFLAPFKLHPLVLEDCISLGHSTLISRYERSFYLEFPTNNATASLYPNYLGIIGVPPHTLITIHHSPMPTLSDLAEDIVTAEIKLTVPRRAAVLYQILDALVDQNIMVTLRLRREIDQMIIAFDENYNSLTFNDILEMKRRVSQLALIGEDQLYCITALVKSETSALNIDDQREYFRDLTSTAEHALRFVNRQETRLTELYDQYRLMLHDRTENKLRVLTIISAIFLPLTLIAGIYGMNFQYMPELGHPYAYPLTLGLMVTVAGGMILYFRYRGWFD